MILRKDWEFNVLQICNYNKTGKLERYFNFIRNNIDELEGDICEVGVYRGHSLLATALLLKELGSNKIIFGFDSFSGFPSYHENDSLSKFDFLYKNGNISENHYQDYILNIKHKEFVTDAAILPSTISSSMDFSETSRVLLEKKIDYLELDNVRLMDGDFKETMQTGMLQNVKFMSVLMDCDLYESHKIALPFVWDRMVCNAYLYLDEFYSLKFPGARIAVNEFFEHKLDKPAMYPRKPKDFERWFVMKSCQS